MSSEPPLVTIGIATRNRCELLRKAVASALAQTWPNKEIVVIDDGSTDGTPELVTEFPGVWWIRNKTPQGYMALRERMMQEASGAYFCSLDDDAWFLTGDELAEAVSLLESRPDVAAAAFDILSPARPAPRDRSGPQPVDTFIGCGHLLRLSDVRACGGYVALPGNYGGEEKDLCLRFFDRGWDVVLLPGVHVWHERTPVGRDAAEQHASGVCNDLAFAWLRFPAGDLAWRLPAKLASHIRFAMRVRQVGPCLTGVMRFLAALPSLTRLRNPVSRAALRKSLEPARRKPPTS